MSESIRKKFKQFLGDDARYEKFVRHLNGNHKGRLLFKQEQCWNDFCEKVIKRDIGFSELLEIFRVCSVHGNTLFKGAAQAFHGEIDYSQNYMRSRNENFPNAHLKPVMVPSSHVGNTVEVWYCEACREAEKEFEQTNKQ